MYIYIMILERTQGAIVSILLSNHSSASPDTETYTVYVLYIYISIYLYIYIYIYRLMPRVETTIKHAVSPLGFPLGPPWIVNEAQ